VCFSTLRTLHSRISYYYHGNYGGPGWSAGKFQNSVVDYSVPPVDEEDEAYRQHDANYYYHKDNRHRAIADWQLVHQLKGKGTRAELARSVIALQALGRDTYSYISDKMSRRGKGKKPTKQKPSQQKKDMPKAKKKKIPRFKGPRPNPVANISSRLVSSNLVVRTGFKATTNGMSAVAQGTELIGSITVHSTDGHGKLLFLQNIAPQFLDDTRIQAFSQMFEKYKYDFARLHLRSKCSNSTNGSVIAYFERDVSEPLPGQNPDAAKRNAQTWGAADVPVKMDGSALMRKIPSENPYLTDLSGSQNSVTYGQARAIVQLNSTGSTVTSGELTVYDVLLEYRCRFFVPALQEQPLLFYTIVNPTGSGCSTSYFLSNDMSYLEQGGTYAPINYTPASGNTATFTLKYGHYYALEWSITGTTINALSFTLTCPIGTITSHKIIASTASGGANTYTRIFSATNTNPDTDQTGTITFAGTTITTPTFVSLTLYDYGSTFNPSNPVPGPSMTMSKWVNTEHRQETIQDSRIANMESQLRLMKKEFEMYQMEQSFGEPKNYSDSRSLNRLKAQIEDHNSNSNLKIQPLSECNYCGMDPPDHLGRNCPRKTSNK
jgi:hypothetical protein